MQNRLFDLENHYASLSDAGDPLKWLDAVVDWEIFRPIMQCTDANHRKSSAGRKPTCLVLLFKLLILQCLHGLSDKRVQYHVTGRLSFMRFLRLDLTSDVPNVPRRGLEAQNLRRSRLAFH